MAVERTLTIIKPDAVEKGIVGAIIASSKRRASGSLAAKMIHLPRPRPRASTRAQGAALLRGASSTS